MRVHWRFESDSDGSGASLSLHFTHSLKKQKREIKNKDSSENLHEALESHHWVENLFWGGLVMPKTKNKKKTKKRIRSLGENLPWRCRGQAIRVKISLRCPSCFQKKEREKEEKEKWILMCIASCRRTIGSKRRCQRAYFTSSTLFSIISDLSSTPLCFSGNCVFYRRPCVFYRRLL